MKQKFIILILNVCLAGFVSNSNAQQAVFNKVYYDVVQGFHILGSDITPDHGYVMAGRKYENDGHIIKIDSSGNVEWSKQVMGMGNYGGIHDVICNGDSTMLTAGVIYSSSVSALNVIKWDKNGDTLWTRNLSGMEYIRQVKMAGLSDRGYLITASSLGNYSLSNVNSMLVKLSESGDLVWSKTYTSDQFLIMPEIVRELPDRKLLIAGYAQNRETNDIHLFISGTDENGNPDWSEILLNQDGHRRSLAADFSVTPDGVVVLAEIADRTSIIKMNFDGSPVWARSYPLSFNSMWTDSKGNITRLQDENLIITCSTYAGAIMKTDASGIPQWIQSVFMEVVKAVPSGDGGYMVFGNGPIIGIKTVPVFIPQIGAYKTDSEGNGGSCINPQFPEMLSFSATFNALEIQAVNVGNMESRTLTFSNFPVMVEDTCVAYTGGINNLGQRNETLRFFPNPANDIFSVEISGNYSNKSGILEIISREGRLVRTFSGFSDISNGIKAGNLPEGIYLVRLMSGNTVYTGKLMIKH